MRLKIIARVKKIINQTSIFLIGTGISYIIGKITFNSFYYSRSTFPINGWTENQIFLWCTFPSVYILGLFFIWQCEHNRIGKCDHENNVSERNGR